MPQNIFICISEIEQDQFEKTGLFEGLSIIRYTCIIHRICYCDCLETILLLRNINEIFFFCSKVFY